MMFSSCDVLYYRIYYICNIETIHDYVYYATEQWGEVEACAEGNPRATWKGTQSYT